MSLFFVSTLAGIELGKGSGKLWFPRCGSLPAGRQVLKPMGFKAQPKERAVRFSSTAQAKKPSNAWL